MVVTVHVQQVPFSWDLTMSQKVDSNGNLVGPYGREDLEICQFPERCTKGKRKRNLRKLHYELAWHITEMQVKVDVRALFPNPIGPLTAQLAKERRFGENERVRTGESRSTALIKDIEITTAADLGVMADGVVALENWLS
jgi:hypothetical protein